MENTTSETIAEIFYSGQFSFFGDLEITNKISFLINNGYLFLNRVTLCTKDYYLEVCTNSLYDIDRDDAAGGSVSHAALKIIGQQYIQNTYGLHSYFEKEFKGFFPDVLSEDRSIICECGHTNNPEKIFTYFRQREVLMITQIPYPIDTDKNIYGYIFTQDKTLIPFLDFEAKDTSVSIKNIINRRNI